MRNHDFEKGREERWNRRGSHAKSSRIWTGLFLLIIGGLYLAKASGVAFPYWFFTWPVLLIGIGLLIGVKHGFRGVGWLFPIGVGAIFLADKVSPDINLRPYIWPIILIAAGLFVIFRPKSQRCGFDSGPNDTGTQPEKASSSDNPFQTETVMSDRNDVIDVTAIFGGVKKNLLSKNFRGGDIVAVMGGAEINLTQADFNGRVAIDCLNLFGGTKLIIPPDWEVQSDVVAIFGGVDDKRPPSSNPAAHKVIYLDGTCIFGGLEIKSF